MALIIITISLILSYSCLSVINNDIVAGAGIIGIDKGVRVISERVLRSSSIFFLFIPLCFVNSPVNNAKPDDAIINPLAIFNAFSVIPKNNKRNFPIKNEMSKMINTLTEVQKAILFRSFLFCSCVKLTKTGTVPKGFITENKAPKIIINRSEEHTSELQSRP